MTAAGVVRKIFAFPYLSLKLSLTLPYNGKVLWCSYFRPFIKSINLERCGNLIEKFNFVSTSWKIIIPLAHHPPYYPPNTPSPIPPPPTPSPTYPTHPTMTPHPTTTHPPTHPKNSPTNHPQRKVGL